MKKWVLIAALCVLAAWPVCAQTDITVNFPSNSTFYSSATNGSGLMGSNGGVSAYMWTAGDYITETFTTGQSFVNDLTANWGVFDGYGGFPGTTYINDVYINGTWVADFVLGDCGYCDTLYTVGGTVGFAPIYGSGTYTLTISLAGTAAPGAGSEWFSTTTGGGGASTAIFSTTPEPGTLLLLGSGLLGLIGYGRRKLRP